MPSWRDVWSAQGQLLTSDVPDFEMFCNPHAASVSDPHILLSFFLRTPSTSYVVQSNTGLFCLVAAYFSRSRPSFGHKYNI